MSDFEPVIEAQLAGATVVMALLLEADFVSQPFNLWTGVGARTFGNRQWEGIGSIIEISEVTRLQNGQADPFEVTVAAADELLRLTAATAPVITTLPNRFGQVFASPITLDLNPYVSDANTPLSELGASMTFSNAPSGTTKGGTNNLVLTIPVNAATQQVVSVTITNRAGLTATRSFDLTIIPFNPGTGGGGGGYGGGGDIRLDPY